jgi:Putative phage metallopeptidase
MGTEYLKPDKEVRSLVKAIRKKYYSKYSKAKIVTLMRLGKWRNWGTLGKVSKKLRQAGVDGDYLLTLNGTAWPLMTDKQKKALVDHELLHMKIKKSKKGNSFVLRDHDVEEFVDIVKRYGAWRPNLEELKKVLNK